MNFIDVFTGYPGSVHDARVFRNIDQFLSSNLERFFQYDEYTIGDKAYLLLNWCITPFTRRGPLIAKQTLFNKFHASSRVVIERSFALLLGRFRRLRHLDMNRIDLIPAVILAACTLHNICLKFPEENRQ